MFLLLYKLFFLSHSLTRSARFEWLWLLIHRLELKNFPSGISRLASDSTPDMPVEWLETTRPMFLPFIFAPFWKR